MQTGGARDDPAVQLLGSGTILREVRGRRNCWKRTGAWPRQRLELPSFNELARDGQAAERWNLLHPTEEQRLPSWRNSWASTPAP